MKSEKDLREEKEYCNRERKKLYMGLGEAYYKGSFEDPLPQLFPFFEKITQCSHKIAEIDFELQELKRIPAMKPEGRVMFCSCCGSKLGKYGNYCGNCGARVR